MKNSFQRLGIEGVRLQLSLRRLELVQKDHRIGWHEIRIANRSTRLLAEYDAEKRKAIFDNKSKRFGREGKSTRIITILVLHV